MLAALPCMLYLLLAMAGITFSEVVEPHTKHVYASREDHLDLAGVGVRVKKIGPIGVKIYSAAVYLDKSSTIGVLKKLASRAPEESIPSSGVNKKGAS